MHGAIPVASVPERVLRDPSDHRTTCAPLRVRGHQMAVQVISPSCQVQQAIYIEEINDRLLKAPFGFEKLEDCDEIKPSDMAHGGEVSGRYWLDGPTRRRCKMQREADVSAEAGDHNQQKPFPE